MIWIKVLAPSQREKGSAFELLMRQVLDSCGLSPSRTRLRVTGAGPLLDTRGRQRKDDTPYVGECRALSREVTRDEVKNFFQRYRRERRKRKKLQGLFLSCTPFSPKVFAWYLALPDDVRQGFHILGPDFITSRLADGHRLLEMAALEAEVSASSTLSPGPRFVASFGGNLYWVQTLLIRRRPAAFFVLEGRGGEAPRTICQEIKRLDTSLRDKYLLDLALRKQTLLELLSQDSRTTDDLAHALGEKPREVLGVLQWLEKEELISSQRTPGKPRRLDRYRLQRGLPVFLHLARQFLPGADRFRFLASEFAAQIIATGLVPYLEERLRLRFAPEDIGMIVNLLSISPAALSFALSSAQGYVSSDRDTDASIPEGERQRLRETASAKFVSDMSVRAITDSFHEEFSSLLAARDVRAYVARIQLKAATLHIPLFSLNTFHLHTLPAGKPAPDADLALEFGVVMRHIQEYDHAIQYLDRAIRDLKDPARLKSAWNNKGLCFFNKRRYQEAIECFNEAIKFDSNLKQAWFNKSICLREVGDTLGAMRCVKRALEIDPSYKEAKDLIQRLS
ncbi:MAG: tetratricopeptide repeat protein [Candidatus Methylomirabilales bacterium]